MDLELRGQCAIVCAASKWPRPRHGAVARTRRSARRDLRDDGPRSSSGRRGQRRDRRQFVSCRSSPTCRARRTSSGSARALQPTASSARSTSSITNTGAAEVGLRPLHRRRLARGDRLALMSVRPIVARGDSAHARRRGDCARAHQRHPIVAAAAKRWRITVVNGDRHAATRPSPTSWRATRHPDAIIAAGITRLGRRRARRRGRARRYAAAPARGHHRTWHVRRPRHDRRRSRTASRCQRTPRTFDRRRQPRTTWRSAAGGYRRR